MHHLGSTDLTAQNARVDKREEEGRAFLLENLLPSKASLDSLLYLVRGDLRSLAEKITSIGLRLEKARDEEGVP